MIIDGEETFRAVLKASLERAGFTTSYAATGHEALDMAREERFRLVCCSFQLPDISGSECCGQIGLVKGYDLASIII